MATASLILQFFIMLPGWQTVPQVPVPTSEIRSTAISWEPERAGYCLAVQIKHPYDNGEVDEGATPDAIIHSMDELLPF